MEDLKKIYGALVDERSKYIFEERRLFYSDGDAIHFRNIVEHEMELYADDQMNSLINWLKDKESNIVVFGAGFAGGQIVNILTASGYKVGYIADNDRSIWGRERSGIKIISPENICTIDGAAVIVGVNAGKEDVYEQLIRMNIDEQCVFRPKKDWWLGEYDQYFDNDFIIPHDNEVFVDGGALDGGDSLKFMKWCNNSFAGIFALEPDSFNCEVTRSRISGIKGISVIEKGLWDSSTILRFDSGKKGTSAVSNDGDIEIKTIAIDELEPSHPVSFIKLDVEGCESRALKGAHKTICTYKPRLAVCVYHKPEDIIELPKLILDMVPDYKLYLRHYSYTDTETVLYAVCE